MQFAKSLTILTLCILSCSDQASFAQSPLRSQAPDRPTQRWLPLPQGDDTDLSEQAQLLQQLRDMMLAESGDSDSTLPKLSEQQLKQMEKALDEMRDQIGEDKLPNLENIPKEWIDQALSDPVVRKQAKQLLEQYARDRKLPMPRTDRAPKEKMPKNADGVPFPRRQPNDRTANTNPNSQLNSQPNPNQNSQPSLQPKSSTKDSSDELSTAPKPQNDRSLDSQDRSLQEQPNAPKTLREDEFGGEVSEQPMNRPDAERIEALKELFDKLKRIEGQRQVDTNTPKDNSGNSGARNTTQRSSAPANSSARKNGATPPSELPKNMPSRTSETPIEKKPAEATRTRPSSEARSSERSNESNYEPPQLTPQSTPESGGKEPAGPGSMAPNPTSSNPMRSDRGSSASSLSKSKSSSPGATSEMKSSRSNPQPQSTQSNELTGNSSEATSSSAKQDMDIKTQLERQGLGSALRSILEKTIKEQGESTAGSDRANSKSPNAQPKPKEVQSVKKASPSVPQTTSPSRKPNAQNPNGITNTDVAKNSSAQSPGNENPNQSSTMTGLRDMAAQFWGAVRSTPNSSSAESSGSVSEVAGGGLGEVGFEWSGRVWLLLALLGLGAVMLFLVARKRIELATAAREADAELAKEILTEGIKTRADVVRAFHRFVLRSAQPVANWWNHRYVASRLTEGTPQLRSVISDLASVYEHARYLPPEVELTSDELIRVQVALQKCLASAV